MRHLRPAQLKEALKGQQAPFLLDVREPWEHEIAAIPGSHLIPMAELPSRVSELPRDRDIVVYCHHGVRSMQVAYFLDVQGLRVVNLLGGIDVWSMEADPDTPRY